MNIGFITTYPPAHCGIATYSENLIENINKTGGVNRVIILGEKGAKVLNEDIICDPCFHRKENYSEILLKKALEYKADLIHIQHTPDIMGCDNRIFNLLSGLKENKIRTILTMHTVYTRFSALIERKPFISLFHNRLGKLVDGVIVHNHSMKKILTEHGVVAEKIYVIPHGTKIHGEGDPQKGREIFNLSSKKKVLLFFGFIHIQKNIHTLLNAMPEIIKEIPDIVLLIAGEIAGNEWYNHLYRRFLKYKIKSLNIENYVRIVQRFIEESFVPHIYSMADIVLLPHSQGYASASGVLHQAFGFLRPLVCSDISKFVEVKENISKELMVKTKDFHQWANRILKILKDPNFKKYILEKIAFYADQTRWERIAKLHTELYLRYK